MPEHVWQDTKVVMAMHDGDFGSALARVRKLASLRQEEMARVTGLSQPFLSALESGSRRLTHYDKIVTVLERLNVPKHALPQLFAQNAPKPVEAACSHSDEPVAQEPWESPLDVARRLSATITSNTDPATLTVLAQQIGAIVDRYEADGPHRLAPKTAELRNFIQTLLEGRQPPGQRAELYRLAAQASGLLSYMAVNAGHDAIAEAYSTEALQLAQEVDDSELMMWIFGTRSLGAYYAGRYDQALKCADAGLAIDPGNAQAIRLLVNGRARALGKLGDATGAQRAIAEAEDLSNDHRLPCGLTPCISFAPYSIARTLANAATAHVALGNTREVIEYAEQVDELVEQSDSAWSRALVRLDVATALLADSHPDVEHAMMLGMQVLEAGGGPPIRSVIQRAGELHVSATTWHQIPAVKDYAEALRSWHNAPLTQAVTSSAKMALSSDSRKRRAPGAAYS
ncbi:helix-turn-helix domain-containing protein [Streptomyces afghaniensis]|uniref:helix-turn-helix domain-containing protein n=1 Tax=Streptomyces afghaniensis TaxID=66865 RepID=UPI0027D79D5A|nr:helix-turn-helix domain-containing protein [Streptomyces afghaniensis]